MLLSVSRSHGDRRGAFCKQIAFRPSCPLPLLSVKIDYHVLQEHYSSHKGHGCQTTPLQHHCNDHTKMYWPLPHSLFFLISKLSAKFVPFPLSLEQ
eukprot:scaffold20206_cov34-Tisochrysis_lutea.AAC.6